MKGISSIVLTASDVIRGIGYGPRRSNPKPYRRVYRLNRSRRHPPANNYEHARDIAFMVGTSNRPVR